MKVINYTALKKIEDIIYKQKAAQKSLKPTTVVRNYWHNYKKRYCFGSHKQFKTLFRDHMVKLKIISLYIHKDLKDLRLRILGLMSHVTIITKMAT